MAYTGKNNQRRTPSPKRDGIIHQNKADMALGRQNFIMMAIAGLMIVVGFILMVGPSSTPDHFEPDIFSTRRIVVGPTLAFLGFLFMAIAIIVGPDFFKRKKADKKAEAEATQVIEPEA